MPLLTESGAKRVKTRDAGPMCVRRRTVGSPSRTRCYSNNFSLDIVDWLGLSTRNKHMLSLLNHA